ncbi:hypothetical protein BH09BAC1_BH09BAC1_23500 [soil metagenome]
MPKWITLRSRKCLRLGTGSTQHTSKHTSSSSHSRGLFEDGKAIEMSL